MKRGTIEHPKTKRLARLLNIRLAEAVGLLEAMFHFGARHAPQGNLGKWSDEEIAEGMYWEGAPADLLAALIKAGWLDADPVHRVIIHGWEEHAEESVRKLLQRRGLAFVSRHVETTAENVSTCPTSTPDMSRLARGYGEAKAKAQAGAVATPEILVTLWNEIAPSATHVRAIGLGKRLELATRVCIENPSIPYWRDEIMPRRARSAFLRGDRGDAWKGRGCTFDWLLENHQRVAEGQFDDPGDTKPARKKRNFAEEVRMYGRIIDDPDNPPPRVDQPDLERAS